MTLIPAAYEQEGRRGKGKELVVLCGGRDQWEITVAPQIGKTQTFPKSERLMWKERRRLIIDITLMNKQMF